MSGTSLPAESAEIGLLPWDMARRSWSTVAQILICVVAPHLKLQRTVTFAVKKSMNRIEERNCGYSQIRVLVDPTFDV